MSHRSRRRVSVAVTVLVACIATGAFASSAFAIPAWYLKNSNSAGYADQVLAYGNPGDHYIAGDWNGDGIDTPGVARPNSVGAMGWYLRNSNTSGVQDIGFAFGNGTDGTLAGDGNGDGKDTPAVTRSAGWLAWYLKAANDSGTAATSFAFGNGTGDVPVLGDWNGDGIATPGVYRRSTATFYLANDFSGHTAIQFQYGNPGNTYAVLAGDWNGDGRDSIGLYAPSSATWMLRNSNTGGVADLQFHFGNAGDAPIVGDWDGNGTDTVGVIRDGLDIPDQSLIRESGSTAVYYYEDNTRYLVTSSDVAQAMGLDLSTTIVVPPGTLALITPGADITMADLADDFYTFDPDAADLLSYHHYDTDQFDFLSANGKAGALGSVKWYHGSFPKGYIHRVQFPKGSQVTPQQPVGCIWAQVKYGWPAGSVTVPTPSVSIGSAEYVQGWAVKCRKDGDLYPDTIYLAGMGFAKTLLNSVTVTICNSASKSDGPYYNCASHKMRYGLG